MFCPNCGFTCQDDMKFCPNCGAALPAAGEPAGSTGAFGEKDPFNYQEDSFRRQETGSYSSGSHVPAEADSDGTPTLVWGILGLVFAVVPLLNFLGIIFSSICLSAAGKYRRKYGELSAKVSVGKGLSIAGLIIGILCTLFYLIVIGAAIFFTSSVFHSELVPDIISELEPFL